MGLCASSDPVPTCQSHDHAGFKIILVDMCTRSCVLQAVWLSCGQTSVRRLDYHPLLLCIQRDKSRFGTPFTEQAKLMLKLVAMHAIEDLENSI